MLELTFTGIGAAFCPSLGNTSAYVRRGQDMILLDCGGTVFADLFNEGVLDGLEKLTCIVTHRHADHTGSLGTLISYAKHVGHFSVTVVHPDPALRDLLRACGIDDDDYHWIGGSRCILENVSLQFYPVVHSASIPAWGFTMEMEGETVYYSGDGEGTPDEVWTAFLTGKIHRVYQDCGMNRHRGHGHFEAMLARTPPRLRSRFFPIHWDCECREQIASAGFGLAF